MHKLKQLLTLHSEYLLLMAAVLLFIVSPKLLRLYDPTAGVYDIGVLQVNITAVISLCIFQSFTWMILKLIWPSLRDYFETQFEHDLIILTPWQKITVGLSLYCFLLLALVLLSRAIPA